jgi:hypothetical protein
MTMARNDTEPSNIEYSFGDTNFMGSARICLCVACVRSHNTDRSPRPADPGIADVAWANLPCVLVYCHSCRGPLVKMRGMGGPAALVS